MQPPIHPFLFGVLLLVGMLLMLEVGRRLAIHHRLDGVEGETGTLVTLETAVFALFGLLIAFTFSGAASRFQEKRTLISDEANAIWGAYMCIDLVASEAQPVLREQFRQYVDARLEIYHRLPNMKGAAEAIARAKSLQDEIWATTITATRLPSRDPAAARMLLNGVEDMVRMNRNRMIALQNHPPVIVYAMLFFLGLLCSLLAGYRMSSRFTLSWLHMASFALVTSSVIYVSMDVEYPRAGLIRLDSADHVLTEIRDNMERATSRLPLPRTENQNGAKGQLGL